MREFPVIDSLRPPTAQQWSQSPSLPMCRSNLQQHPMCRSDHSSLQHHPTNQNLSLFASADAHLQRVCAGGSRPANRAHLCKDNRHLQHAHNRTKPKSQQTTTSATYLRRVHALRASKSANRSILRITRLQTSPCFTETLPNTNQPTKTSKSTNHQLIKRRVVSVRPFGEL